MTFASALFVQPVLSSGCRLLASLADQLDITQDVVYHTTWKTHSEAVQLVLVATWTCQSTNPPDRWIHLQQQLAQTKLPQVSSTGWFRTPEQSGQRRFLVWSESYSTSSAEANDGWLCTSACMCSSVSLGLHPEGCPLLFRARLFCPPPFSRILRWSQTCKFNKIFIFN